VNPDRHFSLVESTGKKARFIQHAAGVLGLTNVEVANVRAEAWKPTLQCDTVVARALSSLADFVKVAGHLCAPQGRLLAMKGQYPHDEISALPKPWRVAAVHPLTVPGLEAERHLVEIAR
jgi:16S rRNA (guanine527-N7)-methyltransferase